MRPANKPELHSSRNGCKLLFTSHRTELVDGQLGHPASPVQKGSQSSEASKGGLSFLLPKGCFLPLSSPLWSLALSTPRAHLHPGSLLPAKPPCHTACLQGFLFTLVLDS